MLAEAAAAAPAAGAAEPVREARLRLGSGVGLVAANMIGSGVFLSAGFMAQDMGPGAILLAWVVGGVLALSGAIAYGAVARMVPKSGGEYRYLSELLHPSLGYLAGWASLLVGFSAPIAADALAAGAFTRTLVPGVSPTTVGTGFVIALTAVHALRGRASVRTQNGLVIVKALLLGGFVLAGLALGSTAAPGWTPPSGAQGIPMAAFAGSLFYVAFAYSGWNAAVYAAEEFEDPERNVPRSMVYGTLAVAALYLAVNWVFVANLTPQDATVVFRYETDQVTLGHSVLARLVGPRAGAVWSAATVLVFLSAMSAMIFLGPRVYAAMARDGFLPRALCGREGRPAAAAVWLQCALALAIVYTQPLRAILLQVGAILVFFAALTALGLVVARVRGRTPRPDALALGAAIVYVASSVFMFWKAFADQPKLLVWLAVAAAAGVVAWAVQHRRGTARG